MPSDDPDASNRPKDDSRRQTPYATEDDKDRPRDRRRSSYREDERPRGDRRRSSYRDDPDSGDRSKDKRRSYADERDAPGRRRSKRDSTALPLRERSNGKAWEPRGEPIVEAGHSEKTNSWLNNMKNEPPEPLKPEDIGPPLPPMDGPVGVPPPPIGPGERARGGDRDRDGGRERRRRPKEYDYDSEDSYGGRRKPRRSPDGYLDGGVSGNKRGSWLKKIF